MSASIFLEKADEALKAARLALENHCFNSAANRSYYALFHAARAALIAAGKCSLDQKWSHPALHSEFARLVRSNKRWPSHLNSYLIKTLSVRELADYSSDVVSSRMAQTAVDRAHEFIQVVRRVLNNDEA